MKIFPSMIAPRLAVERRSGSTLVAAVLTLCLLSLIAANVLFSISSRYNSAYRSVGWNEALLTAESGVDVTLSELFRLIPNVSLSSVDGLSIGYSQPSLGLLNGLQISPTGQLTNGTAMSLTPPALIHGGEGGTTQQATVTLEKCFRSVNFSTAARQASWAP